MSLAKTMISRGLTRVPRCLSVPSFSTSSGLKSDQITTTDDTKPRPLPSTTPKKDLKFDQVIHTGQAWDSEDFRLARFTEAPKEVNTNIAMHLVAKVAPIACKTRVTHCDGGDGPLGHPRVFINLDKPGTHACGYCGLRFYKEGLEAPGVEHIQV